MRFLGNVVCVVCFVVLVCPLFGQQAATPKAQSSTQASLLAQRAHAGLAGTTPINDVTLIGKARRTNGSDEEMGTTVLKASATGEARLEFSFPFGTLSEVVSHSDKGPVGQWSGPDGKPHDMAQHNLATEAAWFFPVFVLQRMITLPNSVLAHTGNEMRDGRAVEHLSASKQFMEMPSEASLFMERLSKSEIYLDSATLLPAVISFNTHPDNNALRDIPVEIRFSDYRSVNGAQVPYHIQKYVNGGLLLDLQFETVTLNTGLSASAFSLQ
jgi:hypothetical protein